MALGQFRFNSRAHHSYESIATYIYELHCLAHNCPFGDALNNMLWDHLVCAIRHERMQQQTLGRKKIHVNKIKIVMSMYMYGFLELDNG